MTHERVVVEADGGSRGNPGPAGYGAVVFDADTGEVLAEAKDAIGTATNNVAEYRGLIAGLTAARELGATSVAVRMDSKLVVEQMKGAWQVKNEGLRPLALEAQALRREFVAITFEWIPRAKNAHADRLANEAMDEAAGIAPKTAKIAPKTAKTVPTASAVPTSPATQATGAAPVPSPGSWTPSTGALTRFVLVRHGSTRHSLERRFSGRNELPLDDAGQEQVSALAARRFGQIDAVVSSPLRRAVETAAAIAAALGLHVETVDDLAETDFGQWEGLTAAEVGGRQLARWRSSLDEAPPGGESFATVQRRVRRAMAELSTRYAGQTVLVVSHVTPIKLVLGAALQAPEAALFRIHLDTASVSVVEVPDEGDASVRLVNDTSHLTL